MTEGRNNSSTPPLLRHRGGWHAAMADWHYGYGFPIGGVVATDSEAGELGGAISPGGVGFDINCGVRFLALDATAQDIPNLKKLLPAGSPDEYQQAAPEKAGVDINHQDLNELSQRGAHAAADLGHGLHEDSSHLESQGVLNTDEANLSHRAKGAWASVAGNPRERKPLPRVTNRRPGGRRSDGEGVGPLRRPGGGDGFTRAAVAWATRCARTMFGNLRRRTNCLLKGFGRTETWGYELPDRNWLQHPSIPRKRQAYLDAMNAAAEFWPSPTELFLADRLRTVPDALNWALTVRREPLYDVAHNIAKMETHAHPRQVLLMLRSSKGRHGGHSEADHLRHWVSVLHDRPARCCSRRHGQRIVDHGRRSGRKQRCFWLILPRRRASPFEESSKENPRRHGTQAKVGGDRAFGFTLRHPTLLARRPLDAYKDADEVIALTAKANLARPVARMNPLAVIKG